MAFDKNLKEKKNNFPRCIQKNPNELSIYGGGGGKEEKKDLKANKVCIDYQKVQKKAFSCKYCREHRILEQGCFFRTIKNLLPRRENLRKVLKLNVYTHLASRKNTRLTIDERWKKKKKTT